MKERPILFSAPMVKALLEGRKTMTRRIVKPEPVRSLERTEAISETFEIHRARGWRWKDTYVSDDLPGGLSAGIWERSPYGEPGDRLWAKETWWHHGQWRLNWNGKPNDWHWDGWQPKNENAHLDDLRRFDRPDAGIVSTKDNREAGAMVWRLRPSLYLPRWASRITLEVTDVRVERLQDITADDAVAEGIAREPNQCGCEFCSRTSQMCPATATGVIEEFRDLWVGINGVESWASNPWVWVVSFKRVCQCESATEEPGPHLATCPWSDPNYDDGAMP